MTSKCKNCGHEDNKHFLESKGRGKMPKLSFCKLCPCLKFQPGDGNLYNKKGKMLMELVQKKGCGKMVRNDFFDGFDTFTCGHVDLCPSCSNQSSKEPTVNTNTPEDNSELIGTDSSGTFNLSDNMVKRKLIKRESTAKYPNYLKVKDVQEFIRRLNELLHEESVFASEKHESSIMKEIDKLAGPKLLEGGKENDR